MKVWQKILVVIVVGLFALSVFKDVLIKTAVTSIGSSVIGAPLKIGGLGLGILTQKVRIKNLKLYNPPGFPQDEPLVDIPEISIDADIAAFLKGSIHVPYAVINVKQMTIIKNKEGKLNVDSLKMVEAQKEAMQKGESKEKVKAKGKDMAIALDYLRLNVGEVVLKDLQKDPPAVTAYSVNIHNKEYKNITSVAQLTTLIMVEGMGPTGLKSAGLYAASTFLGVAFLPAGVAGVLLGNDDVVGDFNARIGETFDALLVVINADNGKIKLEDRTKGVVKASVQGCDVAAKIESVGGGKTKVTISARQYLMPKPEVAGGILHQLEGKIK